MIATGGGCGCSEPFDMAQACSSQREALPSGHCEMIVAEAKKRLYRRKEKVARRNVEVIGS
jgi:hypothetical protein